jgi:hypothetical protein
VFRGPPTSVPEVAVEHVGCICVCLAPSECLRRAMMGAIERACVTLRRGVVGGARV